VIEEKTTVKRLLTELERTEYIDIDIVIACISGDKNDILKNISPNKLSLHHIQLAYDNENYKIVKTLLLKKPEYNLSILIEAIIDGNNELTYYLLNYAHEAYILDVAAKHNRPEIVTYLMNLGYNNFSHAFIYMCMYGHIEIVKTMLPILLKKSSPKKFISLELGLVEAIKNNHYLIISLLISEQYCNLYGKQDIVTESPSNIDQINFAIVHACGYHLDIVKKLPEPKNSNLRYKCMITALEANKYDIVQYLVSKGIPIIHECLFKNCNNFNFKFEEKDNIYMIQFDNGLNVVPDLKNIVGIMHGLVSNSKMDTYDITKTLVEIFKQKLNINELLESAHIGGKLDIIVYLIGLGGIISDRSFRLAAKYKRIDIVLYILSNFPHLLDTYSLISYNIIKDIYLRVDESVKNEIRTETSEIIIGRIPKMQDEIRSGSITYTTLEFIFTHIQNPFVTNEENKLYIIDNLVGLERYDLVGKILKGCLIDCRKVHNHVYNANTALIGIIDHKLKLWETIELMDSGVIIKSKNAEKLLLLRQAYIKVLTFVLPVELAEKIMEFRSYLPYKIKSDNIPKFIF
jgi:hypothetical protein